MKKLNILSLMFLPALTFLSLTLVMFSSSCTSDAPKPTSLSFSEAVYGDVGYHGYEGTMKRTFQTITDLDTIPTNVEYSIVDGDSQIVDDSFKIDASGKLTWESTIAKGEYKFKVNANDLKDGLEITSDEITINIIDLPPLSVINSRPNPTDFNFGQFSPNPLSDFTYSKDDHNHTLTINGFSGNAIQQTLQGSGESAWVIYPNDTYEIGGVEYAVTTIYTKAFYYGNLPQPQNQTNVVIKLNKSMVNLQIQAFYQQGSKLCSPSDNTNRNRVYIDLSDCQNLYEEREDNEVKNTGYWFYGGVVKAFIPPAHCESLTWWPDDVFETSYFECDIDLRNFVKLDTLGHWSIGRWNMGDATNYGGVDNTALDINGADGKSFGSLALPNSIEKLTWATFASSQINILYWNITDISEIILDNDSATSPGKHWYGNIFSSMYINTIYMDPSATPEDFNSLLARATSDGISKISTYGYGPNMGTPIIVNKG